MSSRGKIIVVQSGEPRKNRDIGFPASFAADIAAIHGSTVNVYAKSTLTNNQQVIASTATPSKVLATKK